jgi:hypothetical protein
MKFYILIAILMVSLVGCSTVREISKNLKSKTLNKETQQEGLLLETSVGEDGGVTPRVKMLVSSDSYQSTPTLPGQAVTTVSADYSIWTGSLTHLRITKTERMTVYEADKILEMIDKFKEDNNKEIIPEVLGEKNE